MLQHGLRFTICYLSRITLVVQSSALVAPSLPNVALNKEAEQSSTYPTSGVGAMKAVDGSRTSGYSYSNLEEHPYWMVDLGEVYVIDRIIVFSNAGQLDNPLINVGVITKLSLDGSDFTSVCVHDDRLGAEYTCIPGTRNMARWVKLENGGDVPGGSYIVLVEVEVLAKQLAGRKLFSSVTSAKGIGSILQTRSVVSDIECAYHCSRNVNCISVNVINNSNGTDCQLLGSDVTVDTDSEEEGNVAFWRLDSVAP